MLTLPRVRVGNPIRHEALTAFPLYAEGEGAVDYLLSDEAIAAGSVVVEVVSESGSVPNLRVDNRGDSRVLFLEGEELRGAKQNRVLNTSVLVAAHSQVMIPVSCVEQGRCSLRTTQQAVRVRKDQRIVPRALHDERQVETGCAILSQAGGALEIIFAGRHRGGAGHGDA